MKNTVSRAVFRECLRQVRVPAALLAVNEALIFVIFRLYGLGTEPFWYAFAVTFAALAAVFVYKLVRERRAHTLRQQKLSGILAEWNALPAPETLAESDYIRMVAALGARVQELGSSFAAERKDTQDFYTAWVHQVKTPVAVMQLALGGTEPPDKGVLREELFRIGQYTDMALAYQRLGSTVNDLLIEEYALDPLIREVIRKFAPQFIYKKLNLEYGGSDLRIVTDKKWFVCMLEQLVSNALKYTPAGAVSITVTPEELCVADTGVGIAPEDLPRIFEKGYTGVNGRLNDKSSGLGLYLCGEAAALLNIPVRAESTPGQGSRFTLDLRGKTATN